MSIASPIPILHNSSGATLRREGDALMLRRPDQEIRIPLRAIERVRAEGRTVAVELTAPAGTVATVHRMDDASEAAVALFAENVNEILPERDGAAEPADGASMVAIRTLTESPDERRERTRKRRRKIGALSVGTVIIALAIALGICGQWSVALTTVLLGPLGPLGLYYGGTAAQSAYRTWYLPRDGIIVQARRVGSDTFLGGRFGTYAYIDRHGVARKAHKRSNDLTIMVAYHQDKPYVATVVESRAALIGDIVFAVFALLFGLFVTGLVLAAAAYALLTGDAG
ncbi:MULTISPECIES: hypothetical protein [unclassified Streptomyces]|uniref:hypothetical protein n=1 Tax=Streptomyces TaxID=1883 RepID=UPI0035E0AA51